MSIVDSAIQTGDQSLVQYGAVGVIALVSLVAVRVLFKRETEAHDRERKRADRLEDELRKLNQAIQDRYIASMEEATRAVGEAMSSTRAMTEALIRGRESRRQ